MEEPRHGGIDPAGEWVFGNRWGLGEVGVDVGIGKGKAGGEADEAEGDPGGWHGNVADIGFIHVVADRAGGCGPADVDGASGGAEVLIRT